MCLCVAGPKLNIAILSHFVPKPDEATEMENGLTLALSREAMKGNMDMEVVLSFGV